jgi:hypothetical protein
MDEGELQPRLQPYESGDHACTERRPNAGVVPSAGHDLGGATRAVPQCQGLRVAAPSAVDDLDGSMDDDMWSHAVPPTPGGSSVRFMTLAVAFKGPEGVVLAADSRVTLTTTQKTDTKELQVQSYFDNATKLLSFASRPNVGAVTSGLGALGTTQPRTIHGFIPEFEAKLSEDPGEGEMKVVDVARSLGQFYLAQWNTVGAPPGAEPIIFLVAGFDKDEPYGRIYEVSVPTAIEPNEYWPNDFGVRYTGDWVLADRVINGIDPRALNLAKEELSLRDNQVARLKERWAKELTPNIPYRFLPLQDCVDMATFLVNMTIVVQGWTAGARPVGGPVDVATITRTDGFQAIRQKQIEVRNWC